MGKTASTGECSTGAVVGRVSSSYRQEQESTRRVTLRVGLIVLAATVFGDVVGYAQQRPGSVYISGCAEFQRQDGESGLVTLTYAAPPGGVTEAWILGGGMFVAPNISIEVEVSGTGTMSSRQRRTRFRRWRLVAQMCSLDLATVNKPPIPTCDTSGS
jgi:hypothetical protein